MTVYKLETLPDSNERWPNCRAGYYRGVPIGDFEAGYVTIPGRLDCTESYKHARLPGGVCPCPHYGYVFSGKIRCVYPDSDYPEEVAVGGDIYLFKAGHVLIYEEATTCVEWNPAAAFRDYMDAVNLAHAPKPGDG